MLLPTKAAAAAAEWQGSMIFRLLESLLGFAAAAKRHTLSVFCSHSRTAMLIAFFAQLLRL